MKARLKRSEVKKIPTKVLNLNIVILVVSLVLLKGCNEELCEDIGENPLRIGFYMLEDGQPMPHGIDSLSVIGLGHDEFLYDNQYNVSMVEVPLDVSADSCGFVFTFPPHEKDTLKVYYERNLTLTSVECGFVTFYEIEDLKVTYNRIQSYSLEEYNVTDDNEEHIQIIMSPIDVKDNNGSR